MRQWLSELAPPASWPPLLRDCGAQIYPRGKPWSADAPALAARSGSAEYLPQGNRWKDTDPSPADAGTSAQSSPGRRAASAAGDSLTGRDALPPPASPL